jgi:hypothetical protein
MTPFFSRMQPSSRVSPVMTTAEGRTSYGITHAGLVAGRR